jgi:hypothetical protein
MRSRISRLRRGVPIGLRAGIVISAAFALLGAAVGTATGVQQAFQQVLVVNTSSSPVPVVGARADGSLTVSGSVNVTASTPLPVDVANFPSTQPVSGRVSSGDRTVIIDSGSVTITSLSHEDMFVGKDVSAYKSVSLYVIIDATAVPAFNGLVASATDGTHTYGFDVYTPQATGFVRTWDHAPPNLSVAWGNGSLSLVTVHWMLVGRAN